MGIVLFLILSLVSNKREVRSPDPSLFCTAKASEDQACRQGAEVSSDPLQ